VYDDVSSPMLVRIRPFLGLNLETLDVQTTETSTYNRAITFGSSKDLPLLYYR
jgi:hypothetical protein